MSALKTRDRREGPLSRLMDLVAPGSQKEVEWVFSDSDGNVTGSVPDDRAREVGPGYSGELRYFIDGKRLEADFIGTSDGRTLARRGFRSAEARTRGFMNLMHAAEDQARQHGCSQVTLDTRAFTEHPKLMERLGYKPLDDRERELHREESAGQTIEERRGVGSWVRYVKKLD
ncbi:MAG: hypothetical protein GF416_04055 [Candidatus Altiarchaeales archaeon]|nr:hypothetical protein [Candidatus Altiarchaeales archaeon]MBD3416293.1 hypothetical protein [Candidatus Altiarchaeales archaeon]